MKLLLGTILLLAASLPAFAHEFWLEPDRFFLNLGERTDLHLFVGEALKKEEERAYQGSKVNAFQMITPEGAFDLRSMSDEDKSPILNFAADHQGTFLFSMERNWAYIKLDADKFEDYLRENGMEYVIAERKRLGESAKEGRERYSRFLKSLLQVGDSMSGIVKNRVSTKLEIVPLDNPYSKKVGDTTKFQIWFDRRPLTDRTVFVDNRDGKNLNTTKFTTDKDGVIKVKLDRKGVWLIHLVVMQRCVKGCGEADWESFWGALSFGVK